MCYYMYGSIDNLKLDCQHRVLTLELLRPMPCVT